MPSVPLFNKVSSGMPYFTFFLNTFVFYRMVLELSPYEMRSLAFGLI